MNGTIRFVDDSEISRVAADKMMLFKPYRVWQYDGSVTDWYAVRVTGDTFVIVGTAGGVTFHNTECGWKFSQASNARVSIEF